MFDIARLTRRDFLKLTAASSISLLFPPAALQPPEYEGLYGRVIDTGVILYDQPSFDSKPLKTFNADTVLPITDVTIGDTEPEYNRTWYGLNSEGYAHSGVIQPARIKLNPEGGEIPSHGRLAEVTVPFTDARWWPNSEKAVAYRLYYATTHWVTSTATDDLGKIWYAVIDDKLRASYYIQASHLRLIPLEELAPISPEIPPEAKHIEVHTDDQWVIAYEYDQPVYMARTATGAVFTNGNYSTPGGWHSIVYKRPSRHMAAGDRAAANSFDLPGIPWVSYFTEDGVAFHGTFWHNDFGKPRSHGCVNLSPHAARWFYLWTTPAVPADKDNVFRGVGTAVNVL
jgi:hypothetical protein